MAEAADELSTPLGQKTAGQKRRFRLPFTAMQALAVLLGLFLVAFIGVALFNDNPLGGEPIARIALRKHARQRMKSPPRRASGLPSRLQDPPPSRPRRPRTRPSPSSTARAASARTS